MHSHTHTGDTHTTNHLLVTFPIEVLRITFGHGLAWHYNGTEKSDVNMFTQHVWKACTHTLSSHQAMHGVEVQFLRCEGGKQWKIKTWREWFGLAGHMSISDSWHQTLQPMWRDQTNAWLKTTWNILFFTLMQHILGNLPSDQLKERKILARHWKSAF